MIKLWTLFVLILVLGHIQAKVTVKSTEDVVEMNVDLAGNSATITADPGLNAADNSRSNQQAQSETVAKGEDEEEEYFDYEDEIEGEKDVAHVNHGEDSQSGAGDLVMTAKRGFPATFRNSYADQTLSLFWISDLGEEVPMGEIEPNTDISFDTFSSHIFFARTAADGQRAHPSQMVMSPDQSLYVFGPASSASTPSSSTPSTPKQNKLFFEYLHHRTTSTSAKFRCLVSEGVDIFYDDGREGVPQGSLQLGQEYTVNTYEGHVFYFTARGNKSREYARFAMDSRRVLYLVEDPASPPAQSFLDHRDKEEAFMQSYLTRTGRQWRHYFGPDGPRPPPIYPMWPADFQGQRHHVNSSEGFWHCAGRAADCQFPEPVQLTLDCLSVAPKVFAIPHFISDYEVEAILQVARPRVAESLVGNKDGGGARRSDTRTSKNTWLPRSTNAVTQSLFRRAEDVLRIAPLDSRNTEDLQVVYYREGQKYDSHHDWGVSGYPESRYITLLLYLSDMPDEGAGGETAFPKGAGGTGFKVHPGKGSAVLFYNLLEDGNGDDLSLHAALPVRRGEKWLANFWVWDPARK